MNEPLDELATKDMIVIELEDVEDALHVAPELFTMRKMVKSPFPATTLGDVYAVGCLIYQISYRLPLISKDEVVKHPSEPFLRVARSNINSEFSDDLLAGKNVKRPNLRFSDSTPMAVAMCVRSCMAEADERKNMKQLRSEVENVLKIKFVVDELGRHFFIG